MWPKSYVIKIREYIDIIAILHFHDKSTSRWYEGNWRHFWPMKSFRLTFQDFWRYTYMLSCSRVRVKNEELGNYIV